MSNQLAIAAVHVLIVVGVLGCGGQAVSVDATPYRQAIVDYLRANDMALAVKTIREGPTLSGDTAQLTASLTHQELGGASVTWIFHFERKEDGRWAVVRHED